MKTVASEAFRSSYFSALALILVAVVDIRPAQAAQECSVSKTNNSCQITVDRSNPVAPPAIQMYSNQTLTVIVSNPLPFERYFLDFTSGQGANTPDVASAIAGSLTGNLGKLTNFITSQSHAMAMVDNDTKTAPASCSNLHLDDATLPDNGDVEDQIPAFHNCFKQLSNDALNVYRSLEPLIGPDALNSHYRDPKAYYFDQRKDILKQAGTYTKLELALSGKLTAMSAVKTEGDPQAKPTNPTYTVEDKAALSELLVYQKLIDAVTSDLEGYEQRLKDLGPCGYVADANSKPTNSTWGADETYTAGDRAGLKDECYLSAKADNKNHQPGGGDFWKPWNGKLELIPSVTIQSRPDKEAIYEGMVTRTVTYSLDTLNLVSYSQEATLSASNKKALGAVVINFADHSKSSGGNRYTGLRWEASAGVFFSWLPARSFSLDKAGNVVDGKTKPTPVPFAAANYRLTEDFGSKWKQNIYLTGAVGVNANNSTAEFGVGPSYSWRLLMINALCHIGHDTRPSSLTPGGSGILPTVSHWTAAPAIGISVRIPSLTGR